MFPPRRRAVAGPPPRRHDVPASWEDRGTYPVTLLALFLHGEKGGPGAVHALA